MATMSPQRLIELWKAIHGGCWPGPPPPIKFSTAVNEVISGLALYNLSEAFAEAGVAKQVKQIAADSLNKSLPALQDQIKRGG
jgi:hypothetical protein